jgi:hypothetical protein
MFRKIFFFVIYLFFLFFSLFSYEISSTNSCRHNKTEIYTQIHEELNVKHSRSEEPNKQKKIQVYNNNFFLRFYKFTIDLGNIK